MRANDFFTKTTIVNSGGGSTASLSIRPTSEPNANELQMLFPHGMDAATRLATADRVLAGVQRWRDGIAAYISSEETAAAELAAAREEIARLKAERGEGPLGCDEDDYDVTV